MQQCKQYIYIYIQLTTFNIVISIYALQINHKYNIHTTSLEYIFHCIVNTHQHYIHYPSINNPTNN